MTEPTTVEEFLALARTKLSGAEMGELAAGLVLELGDDPMYRGLGGGKRVISTSTKWTQGELDALVKMFNLIVLKLPKAPAPTVEAIVGIWRKSMEAS